MSGNYIKLYAVTGVVESAFFLSEGSVYFYASNVDKYAISGSNLIIGSTEIIMKHLLGIDTDRIETAVAEGGSAVKKITADKFIAGLRTYSFALNASMVLAKQVFLTNQILHKNMTELNGEEKKIRDNAVAYYKILTRMQKEYEKRKIPWLKELIEEFTNSLTYKKGEAYCKASEPSHINTVAALSDKEVEYERGAIICEEDTPGSEMYILKSGAVDVFVKGIRISTIDEPGMIIGETSLLLDTNRTATLKAKNRAIVTRITRDDLKEVAEKQQDFISGIAMALAKRHYFNVARIESVNKNIIGQALDRELIGGDKKAALSKRAHKDLQTLKDRLDDVAREKKSDFLRELLENP
jgi:CRP-like cAMP-binding protein